MAPYKFRVFAVTRAGDPIDLAGVVGWLKVVSPAHLLVIRHDADDDDARPHYHALLFSERPVQSLRVSLLKDVPSVKANYSLTEMPTDAIDSYLRYMCHGKCRGDEVEIVHTSLAKYTSAWAQTENRAFWDARKAFKVDKSKQDKSIVDDIIEQLKGFRKQITYRTVVQMILDEYQVRKKTFHVVNIRHQALTIWDAIGGPVQKQQVVDLICQGNDLLFSPLNNIPINEGSSISNSEAQPSEAPQGRDEAGSSLDAFDKYC